MRKHGPRLLAWEHLEDRLVLNAGLGAIPVAGVAADISARGGQDAFTPTQRLDGAAVQQHADNLALADAGEASNVVFFGDSITARWGLGDGPGVPVWNQSIAPMGAVDFGIDGDRTQNILWRMENGELNGQPKVVVVMIGTNNLLFLNDNESPDETVAGISTVVKTIQDVSPQSKVLLLGLLPRSTPNDPIRSEILQVNRQISALQDGAGVVYLDLGALFLRPDGTIPAALLPDGLHPSAAGYQLMADALQGPLNALLGLPAPDPSSYGGPILIDMPADQVVEAADARGAALALAAPVAVDALDPRPVVTSDPPPGAILPIGSTVVTWTASDRFGHRVSASYTVEVQPGLPPVLHDVPADAVVEATGALGAVVQFAPPSATDDTDPDIRVICTPPSGSTFPIGTTFVACTATDKVGNVTSALFRVVVIDSTPPAIPAARGLVVEATGPSGALVNFPPVVDAVDPFPIVRYSTPSGSTFPLGTTVVTATAMDRTGNVVSTTFRVTVNDTPVLHNPPPSLVVEATSRNGAVVSYTPPTVTDVADPSIKVTSSQASGSRFPMGTTSVTSFARGLSGATASASFTVTVIPRATVGTVSALAQDALARAAAELGGDPTPTSRPGRRRVQGRGLKKLIYPRALPGPGNAAAFLNRVDANHDLQVTLKEVTAFISATLDRNRDRKVSLYEQVLAQAQDPQGIAFLFPGT